MLPYTLQYPSAACQVLGGSQTCPTVVRARRGAGSERPQVYETFQALQASCGLYATSWAAWREARIQAVVDQEWPTTRKQGHSKPIGTSSGGRRSRSVPLIDWAWKIRQIHCLVQPQDQGEVPGAVGVSALQHQE